MKTVFVAIYENPDRTDVRVFENEDDVWVWQTELAKDSWFETFDETPPSDEDIGSEYFLRMAEQAEYFSMHPCEREGRADQHSPSPDKAEPLSGPTPFDATVQRKSDHFETLLGILKMLVAPPTDPSFDHDFWRARASDAITKAEAILAGAPDPG